MVKKSSTSTTQIATFVREAREALGLSQESLGEIFGCTKGNISGWEKGLHEPRFAVLTELSKRSRVPLPGLVDLPKSTAAVVDKNQNDPDIVIFDLYDIQASAGPGRSIKEYPQVLRQVSVLESWARQALGNCDFSKVKLITANGTSMEGTIANGDVLFVDVSVRYFDGDGIYVISRSEELHVKRLQRLHGMKLAIISDNQQNKTETLNAQEANEVIICGRVLAAWNLKRLWM